MDDMSKILPIVAVGGLALLFGTKIAKASQQPQFTPNATITAGGTQIVDQSTGEVLAQKETATLVDIPGASWKIPLYLTLERDISLGFFDAFIDIAQGAGTALWTGVSTVATTGFDVLKAAGGYVGSALSGVSSVVTGTVVPAVMDFGSNVAEFISPVTSTLTKAGSAVWDLASSAGTKVWDVVSGAAKYVISNPEQVKTATTALATVAGTVMAIKNADKSQVATSTSEAAQQQQQMPEPTTHLIGYISQTPFTTQWGPSLRVRKLYNPQLRDTLIATNDETVNRAGQVGYQVVGDLGYCSPGPFRGCTHMIMLLNENTADHLLVTNVDIVPKFESIGYKSLGVIGYCKAIEHQ